MLMIRLQRVGRKHDPSFRLVLTDKRNSTKSGRFLEVLGSYNARAGKPAIKGDRVKHWIENGAQVSDTVNNLLIKEKIIEGKTINVLPKKSPIVKEVEEETKPTEKTTEAPAKTEETTPAETAKETPSEEEKSAEENEKPAEGEKEKEATPAEEPKVEEKPAEQEEAPKPEEKKVEAPTS